MSGIYSIQNYISQAQKCVETVGLLRQLFLNPRPSKVNFTLPSRFHTAEQQCKSQMEERYLRRLIVIENYANSNMDTLDHHDSMTL